MNPTRAVLRVASVVALAAAVWWLADLSAPSASYYPLEPGLKWTYEVSSPEGGSAMLTVVNGPRRSIGQWKATEQRMELEQTVGRRFAVEEPGRVLVVAEQAPGVAEPQVIEPPSLVLRLPPVKGDTWDSGTMVPTIAPGAVVSTMATVESVSEQITVPAGTFTGCVRIVSNGRMKGQAQNTEGEIELMVGTRIWYCPGVGLVQMMRRETTDRQDLGMLQLSYKLAAR